MTVADWTTGEPQLVVLSCGGCGNVWYFHRPFCPRCGRPDPDEVASAGRGRVVATTVVHRAPSDEWRPLVPYTLVLVDLDEGVRVMAHAASGTAIGDTVGATFEERAGRLVPVFAPT